MPSEITAENPRADAAITKTATADIVVDRAESVLHGEVSIEYKPRTYTLRPNALIDLLATYEDSEMPVEDLITDLYERIIELVFPGYSGREEPWEQAPLVITIEYCVTDDSEWLPSEGTATLGTYQ